MADGFINVYKEKGYTSFDVVAKLRGILKQKKIGHTGTLDPLAEGVLLVCLGKATKLCDYFTEKNKEYICTMLLGKRSNTEDISGEITEVTKTLPDELQIKAAIMSFVGHYEQIPPMYSAIKVNGKRLYELARQGVEIQRTKRPVDIYGIDIIDINLPEVTFRVSCSKGTYIRSLCRDIGDRLSCGALMKSLLRTEVKGFSIDKSLKLNDIERLRDEGLLSEYIIPLDSLLSDLPAYRVTTVGNKYLLNGNRLTTNELIPETESVNDLDGRKPLRIRVYDSKGDFTAIYDYIKEENKYKPYKMFL